MIDYKNTNVRLLGLSLGVFILAFLANDPFGFFDEDYSKTPPLIREKNISSISEVTIRQSSGDISLIRQNEDWIVRTGGQEFKADSNRINRSLESLLQMKRFHVVTDKKEKYPEYEVTDSDFQLQLKTAKKEYTVILGKQGASYNTSVVRLKDEQDAYSVKGNHKNDWNRDGDYFRDRKLLKMVPENISRIDIKGAQAISLIQRGDAWEMVTTAQNMAANSSRVKRLMDDLLVMEGLSFVKDGNAGIHYGSLTIQLKSNTTMGIEVRKSGAEYLIRSDQNPYWQFISEYRVKSLFPDIKELQEIKGNPQ